MTDAMTTDARTGHTRYARETFDRRFARETPLPTAASRGGA